VGSCPSPLMATLTIRGPISGAAHLAGRRDRSSPRISSKTFPQLDVILLLDSISQRSTSAHLSIPFASISIALQDKQGPFNTLYKAPKHCEPPLHAILDQQEPDLVRLSCDRPSLPLPKSSQPLEHPPQTTIHSSTPTLSRNGVALLRPHKC
jgi:hypothetical protein